MRRLGAIMLALVLPGLAIAREIGPDALDSLPQVDVLVLGEVHDNPHHHAHQARAVRALNPVAMVFEMLQPAQIAALPTDLTDAEAAAEMSFVTGLIDEIRSARAQVHVPAGLKCDLVATELSPAARAAWTRNEALIRRMARIESFSEGHAPKGSIAIAMDGAAFALPLAGLIDITEEKARLQKALDKLTKEINGLKGRLDNPNFVKSAPEDVIIEARSNLEAREDEAAKIKAAVKRLAELG